MTPEDLAAASELAQKMNTSASDYNKITGEEVLFQLFLFTFENSFLLGVNRLHAITVVEGISKMYIKIAFISVI